MGHDLGPEIGECQSRWTARYSHSFMIRCWTGPYVSADRQPDDRQTTSMTAGHYPDRVLDLFANVCPGVSLKRTK